MDGEFDLIARYFAPLAQGAPGADGLCNDAALFEPNRREDLVLTLDTMVEGVHFLPDDPPDLIGRKLLRVNLSDLAAMGARPRGYLLSTAFAGAPEAAWLESFTAGLAADQREFGLVLLGGDTVATPGPLTLTVVALGEVPRAKALRRGGARAGDRIYVSGTIGDGALGLRVLRGELTRLPARAGAALAERYRLPRPRVALGRALAEGGLASAALDISDGLIADLGHIARGSGLGAVIEAGRVPLSDPAKAALAADPELRLAVLTGGDDYELLFTVAPENGDAVAELALALDLPLTQIGHMAKAEGLRVIDETGAPVPVPGGGWTHF
ncbi:MAG: thiamine-phosphate kinase [Kiloniellales bacterium]